MTIHEDSRAILERCVKMVRLVHSIEQHLLVEQQEAIGSSAQDVSRNGSRTSDISDPTHRQAMSGQLAAFARWNADMHQALRGIGKSLNHAERTFTRILGASVKPPVPPVDLEQRCPGWNEELRKRVGGCGKVLERWKDSQGGEHIRSSYLCVGCRKASERAGA